eukprot:8115663-Ditylum_brightwellii.AAC.1
MEQLDNKMSTILDEAEGNIKTYPQYWWLEELHHAHMIVEYWQAVLSYARNNAIEDSILEERGIEIGPEVEIYQGNKTYTSRS